MMLLCESCGCSSLSFLLPFRYQAKSKIINKTTNNTKTFSSVIAASSSELCCIFVDFDEVADRVSFDVYIGLLVVGIIGRGFVVVVAVVVVVVVVVFGGG